MLDALSLQNDSLFGAVIFSTSRGVIVAVNLLESSLDLSRYDWCISEPRLEK